MSDDIVPTWPDRSRHVEFFDEIRAVIERYPELSNHMKRMWEDDPTASYWDFGRGYPAYDPDDPHFLQGIVILVSFANMANFQDMGVLQPVGQSHYMTMGMLIEAAKVDG